MEALHATSAWGSPNVFPNPRQICFTAISDFQHYALRQIVGMKFLDGITHELKCLGGSLGDQQPLCGVLHLALPAVDRLNARNNIDACRQSAFHQRPGNGLRFLFISGRGHHNALSDFCHLHSPRVFLWLRLSANPTLGIVIRAISSTRSARAAALSYGQHPCSYIDALACLFRSRSIAAIVNTITVSDPMKLRLQLPAWLIANVGSFDLHSLDAYLRETFTGYWSRVSSRFFDESAAREGFGISLKDNLQKFFQASASWFVGSRRKLATLGAGLLACLLAYHVVFGANGLVQYEQKRKEYRQVQEQNRSLEQQNQELEKQN